MKVERPFVFISDGDNAFGRAIVRRFAGMGEPVVVNTGSIEAFRAERGPARPGGYAEIVPIEVDLADRSALDAAFDRVAPAPIGAFIHTARVVRHADIESCDEALFDESIRQNVKAAFVCTQSVGRRMVKQGYGRIVYLGSIHGEKPTRSTFAFSVAMGALEMLCREAALELGRHGVTVNLIEMGPIEYDDERFGDELFPLYRSVSEKLPGSALGTAEDAANLAFFLTSEEARYLNGASVRLDGGFVLHYVDRGPR